MAAARAALELLEADPGRPLRLQAGAAALRGALAAEGWPECGSRTQIVPLVVGDAADAMRLCEAALERGVFAQAIRPPTVPEGTSRLRLAVMATHARRRAAPPPAAAGDHRRRPGPRAARPRAALAA